MRPLIECHMTGFIFFSLVVFLWVQIYAIPIYAICSKWHKNVVSFCVKEHVCVPLRSKTNGSDPLMREEQCRLDVRWINYPSKFTPNQMNVFCFCVHGRVVFGLLVLLTSGWPPNHHKFWHAVPSSQGCGWPPVGKTRWGSILLLRLFAGKFGNRDAIVVSTTSWAKHGFSSY